MEEQKSEFTMTELWLVKADWNRTYIGSIKRETAEDGTLLLSGKADVEGVEISAEAKSEEELTNKLDTLCTEILEGNGFSKNE